MIAPKIVNGDLVIDNGDIAIVDKDEELRQSIESILLTQFEEFEFDENLGTYYNVFWDKLATIEEKKDAIREAIAQEERISEIDALEIIEDRKSREMTINLVLIKADGNALQIEGVELNA